MEQFPFFIQIVAQLPILLQINSKIYKSVGLQFQKGGRKIVSGVKHENFEDTRAQNCGTKVENGTNKKVLGISEPGTSLYQNK